VTKATRIIIGAAAFLSLLALVLFFFGFGSSDMDRRLKGEDPIGIFFVMTDDARDDAIDMAAQIVVFPAYKRVLLYCLNTDSFYEDEDEPMSKLSPGSADRFSRLTGVRNEYTIKITRSQAIRFLNVLEGINTYLEEPIVFQDGRFQYPQGYQFFPGEQIIEYALGHTKPEFQKEYLTGVDRLYRTQSMALTLFWNLDEMTERVKNQKIRSFLYSLINTDLSEPEIKAVFSFFSGEGIKMDALAVPLETSVGPLGTRLVVKDKRARNLFVEYRDNLRAGKLDSDEFPVEVLNGTETGGLARKVKQFLQDRGLVVLNTDNFPYKPQVKTVIVERYGSSFNALKLLELTGIDRKRVFFRRKALEVHASIIIGDDFKAGKFQSD